MTQKRFIYCEEENGEFPFPYIEYEGKKVISLYECVDFLNQLNDENEQLKQQIGNLEHTRDFCADVCADCKRLEEENEQLKSELAEIKRQEQEVFEYLRTYHNGDINELKKELEK